MSCGSKKLDETAVSILKALATFTQPASCKEIAEKASLDVRKVTGKIRGLVNQGLIEKAGEGKYRITDKGREAIKA